jgi:hypothetical protein
MYYNTNKILSKFASSFLFIIFFSTFYKNRPRCHVLIQDAGRSAVYGKSFNFTSHPDRFMTMTSDGALAVNLCFHANVLTVNRSTCHHEQIIYYLRFLKLHRHAQIAAEQALQKRLGDPLLLLWRAVAIVLDGKRSYLTASSNGMSASHDIRQLS